MTVPIHHLRFPLAVDAAGGRVAREGDEGRYIEQLIRQVLLTAPGERVHRPSFGAGLRRLVFAPLSPATASLTQTLVFQALDNWLGSLIRVDDVRAEARGERLDVNVTYTVLARREQRFLNLEVTP